MGKGTNCAFMPTVFAREFRHRHGELPLPGQPRQYDLEHDHAGHLRARGDGDTSVVGYVNFPVSSTASIDNLKYIRLANVTIPTAA